MSSMGEPMDPMGDACGLDGGAHGPQGHPLGSMGEPRGAKVKKTLPPVGPQHRPPSPRVSGAKQTEVNNVSFKLPKYSQTVP